MFIQVWCGSHQLDLSMKLFYLAIPKTFHSTFIMIVSYLRCQQNFILDERSQCPLICNTHWINVIKVTTWFNKHRFSVTAYLEENNRACMPDSSWWVLLLVVHEITGIAAILWKYLQVHGMLMLNQHHTLKRLVFDISIKVGIIRRLSEVQRGAIDEMTHQLYDAASYAVSFFAVRYFIEDLVLFVKYCLAEMASGNRDMLLQFSAAAIPGLVDGISAVVTEQNEYNKAYIDAAPSVLPHQLVRILPCNLCVYLQCHRERLNYTFKIEEIDNIRRQHKVLCDAYCRQPELKSYIDRFD